MNFRKIAWAISDVSESLEKSKVRRRTQKEYQERLKSGYFDNDDEDDDDDYDDDDDDDIPVGCRACGGDYPNCADSCPLFD